jgi:DNA (cytosine-5)-methyltransferase 1
MSLQTYAVHFSGMGGACLGLHQAGLKCNLAIEKEALRVEYRAKNLGHQGLAIDIRDYVPDSTHAADILWTSPPCTMLSSLSREYVDMNDPINYLYLESVKYCERFHPKYFILENVMGILTHKSDDHGNNTFTQWRRAFEKIGYHTEWNVLNSKYFGVPQDRERVIMVGSLEGKKGLIPQEAEVGVKFGDIMDRHAIKECWSADTYRTVLNSVARNSAKNGSCYRFLLIKEEDILPTITCSFDGGATRKKLGIIDTTTDGAVFLRQPTVREGARAQGFPDSWQLPESESLAWQMIGDAVTSNVARAIAEHLIKIDEGGKPPCKRALSAKRLPKYVHATNEPGSYQQKRMVIEDCEEIPTDGNDLFGKV